MNGNDGGGGGGGDNGDDDVDASFNSRTLIRLINCTNESEVGVTDKTTHDPADDGDKGPRFPTVSTAFESLP